MLVAAPTPVEARANEIITTLFTFIEDQEKTEYLGERVSQLQHSLQAAHLARQSDADNETILGALLHDVGRFIPTLHSQMPKMIAPDGEYVGRASHEIFGERYLRQLGFSDKICQLVGAHVMAKRYLTAVREGYYESLSETSKKTLKFQGGIFNDAQVAEARKDSLLEEKLAVRVWDDLAKDPDMIVEPISFYKDMAVQSLINSLQSPVA